MVAGVSRHVSERAPRPCVAEEESHYLSAETSNEVSDGRHCRTRRGQRALRALPQAGLRRGHRGWGPDVSGSLALAAKHLPSGLRRENVQPGRARPLCKPLIPSLLLPAEPARPRVPAPGRGCGCLCARLGEGPTWQPSHKHMNDSLETDFYFLSQGTSGFKPESVLFRFYFSLSPTQFHVYL